MQVSLVSPFSSTLDVKELPVFVGTGTFPLKPFDDKIITFFDQFSKTVLSNKQINKIPEIVALAFWLRKNNLLKMKEENAHLFSSKLFIASPVGVVFHICPANVDTMFIYSLAVSVLMGNKNVLRVSNRMNAPHIAYLFELLNKTTEEHPVFNQYINIIKYEHNNEVTQELSKRCAARIIWGGDNTIENIKKIGAASRVKDIVFPDRISILCIESNVFNSLTPEEADKFANNFFNDAYTFDQKGCSSPQSIFVIGEADSNKLCIEQLQKLLSDYIVTRYETDAASIASLKLNFIFDEAVAHNQFTVSGNNLLTFFVQDSTDHATKLEHTCGGGAFNIFSLKDASEIALFNSPKLQTISYFGLSENNLQHLKDLSNGEGIARIVPLGSALDFYYLWDGYNLFDELSKKVFIK